MLDGRLVRPPPIPDRHSGTVEISDQSGCTERNALHGVAKSIESPSAQLQYFTSDLQSLARDLKRGQCKATSVLAKKRRTSLVESRTPIAGLIQSRQVAMTESIAALRAMLNSPKSLQ